MRKAVAAWLVILCWVAVYDAWAMRKGEHTLSAAFRYGARHKRWRLVLWTGWGALTSHLFLGRP